jgi:hypothetical protein
MHQYVKRFSVAAACSTGRNNAPWHVALLQYDRFAHDKTVLPQLTMNYH